MAPPPAGRLPPLREPQTMDTLSALLLGSNIGSDIFQQNFVLPLVSLIGAVVVARRLLAAEVGALIAASILLWLACLGGTVTRIEGGLLVLAYLAYLYYLGPLRHDARSRERSPLPRFRAPLLALLITACFIAMGLLADPVLAAAQRPAAALPFRAPLFARVGLGVCAGVP